MGISDIVHQFSKDPSPFYYQGREVLQRFGINFRGPISETGKVKHIWGPSTDIPLFVTPSPGNLQVIGASDTASTVEIAGLRPGGVFERVSGIPIASIAGTALPDAGLWQIPLIQVELEGPSGTLIGAIGTIQAFIDGTDPEHLAGEIGIGQVRTQSSVRKIPKGQEWIITAVGARSFVSKSEGNKDAGIWGSLLAGFPGQRVKPLAEFGVITPVVTDKSFLEGAYVLIGCETDSDTPKVPIVAGSYQALILAAKS